LTKFVYPWMNRRKPYWVDQKADPLVDEGITYENKEFLLQERLKSGTRSPVISIRNTSKPWLPLETQRCGLIAVKLGMYPLWDKRGEKIDCTILQVCRIQLSNGLIKISSQSYILFMDMFITLLLVPDNHALRYVPPDQLDNYLSLRDPRGDWLNNQRLPSWITQKRWGLQIVGAMSADPIEFTPEWCGLFTSAGVAPKRKISRFLVSPDAALDPGTPIYMQHFRIGDYVDVTARTINRGFQGVIERWGMSGGPAIHGSTKFHRRVGSLAGAGKKVIRGKRMPGVMGNRYRSLRGLQILRMNPRLNLIYLSGPTPGPVHSFCLLHDSWLMNRQHELVENPPPNPTWFPNEEEAVKADENQHDTIDYFDDFAEDLYHESIHRYDEPNPTIAATSTTHNHFIDAPPPTVTATFLPPPPLVPITTTNTTSPTPTTIVTTSDFLPPPPSPPLPPPLLGNDDLDKKNVQVIVRTSPRHPKICSPDAQTTDNEPVVYGDKQRWEMTRLSWTKKPDTVSGYYQTTQPGKLG
uniref:Large ribosomal subunit protein uL3m n=1 Tax=Schistocephalus solidus TaxID=70667 RepID=A0A183SZK1_SCHSO